MNSKIEARIEAVKLALNVEGVTSENIIEVSDKIASFIIGSAELPDRDESADIQKRMMDMVTDAYKRTTPPANPEASTEEKPQNNG